ncbi:DUF561 domain-containing protein [Gloeocapsa sp. PCC 73106]|uniref:DUF561 domain-containing protein n=1 Tax=Gloeocapsa sp. PCC 73106 TaxID=102232 RepID=UPI0002ABD784|nr:Protein of unknown function (DUF561) [Gloeocapsa sp. PCC 73106]
MLSQLTTAFATKKALKIISGLNNFDYERVAMIAKAAEIGGATFIDIAADPHLVAQIRQITTLPICVSAVEPQLLAEAAQAGADLLEIGNFDCFYAQGRYFSATEVLELTKATKNLVPNLTLSVTVPHILALDEQVALAETLVAHGADLIQTEGGTSSNPQHPGVLGLIEKASPTLAAAYSISRAVSVPVLCASGLSEVTVPLAIAAGASGVGVGSAVNQLHTEIEMIAQVRSLMEALAGIKQESVRF